MKKFFFNLFFLFLLCGSSFAYTYDDLINGMTNTTEINSAGMDFLISVISGSFGSFGSGVEVADEFGITVLGYAVTYRAGDVVSSLIVSGVNLNRLDGQGYSALMYAGMYGQWDMATLLLSHGAEKTLSGPNGTAAFIATDSGYSQLADFITNYSYSPPSPPSGNLWSPIMGAVGVDGISGFQIGLLAVFAGCGLGLAAFRVIKGALVYVGGVR